MYGGKFAFQNRLSWLVVGRKFTIFPLFCFVFEGKFQVQAPRRVFCVTSLGGLYLARLIHGRAYFRDFTVSHNATRASLSPNCAL